MLDERAKHQTGANPASLADLYDPLTMPPALLKAHQKLDAAVDKAYEASGGKKAYKSDAERVAFPTGLTPQVTASQQTRRLASGAVVPDVQSKAAETIAEAAHKLTTLRDNWLNPPDWTQRLPEVVPLGMSTSPYPDRIVAKFGHEKELSERTLTKLYNARPAWLASAHAALDAAVAQAYGWTDYTPDMPDETILQRLLALNVERSVEISVRKVA